MTTGTRIEILVAIRNDARWFPAVVTKVHDDDRIDVRLEDGRQFERAHPDSTRSVAVPEQAFR